MLGTYFMLYHIDLAARYYTSRKAWLTFLYVLKCSIQFPFQNILTYFKLFEKISENADNLIYAN